MSLKEYVNRLIEAKKLIIIVTLIGVIAAAALGYVDRGTVNEGVLNCYQSRILVAEDSSGDDVELEYEKKNMSLATTDAVINSVVKELNNQGITTISKQDVKNGIFVDSKDGVVDITAAFDDEKVAEIVASKTVEGALLEYSAHEIDAEILNDATESFTATISLEPNTQFPGETVIKITPKQYTEINAKHTALILVKYGFIGGVLFLLLSVVAVSFKLFMKED